MGRAHEVRKEAMAKTAAAKAKLYSRYGKEIYLSAKQGGPDTDANLSLRRLVEKAKKLIFNQNGKRLLRKRGINGRATIAACYIIVFLQFLLPIVLTMNVLSIIEIFI